ncbi:MAG: Rrf2 family transcriptional regulator [Candidatus Omnitrophota bacterium]|jgi:Rrf2 family protein
MKLVTKDVHYAIKSLLYIAKDPDRVVSVNELVDKLNMRKAFLRRIMQVLSKRGILKSLRGSCGGFLLKIKPDKIRIIDIVSIFRGDVETFSCIFEKDICPYPGSCLLMRKMENIEFQLNSLLKNITIAKLFKSIDR